jgi:hypothetical protein
MLSVRHLSERSEPRCVQGARQVLWFTVTPGSSVALEGSVADIISGEPREAECDGEDATRVLAGSLVAFSWRKRVKNLDF